tara:strand:- start:6697 stop:6900 length:204 start_codon:yes stop_codon:yes gene_type:complete
MSEINISEDALSILVDAAESLITQKRAQLASVREEEELIDIKSFEDSISRCERALMAAEDAIYKAYS